VAVEPHLSILHSTFSQLDKLEEMLDALCSTGAAAGIEKPQGSEELISMAIETLQQSISRIQGSISDDCDQKREALLALYQKLAIFCYDRGEHMRVYPILSNIIFASAQQFD